jgi:hypothetical protein
VAAVPFRSGRGGVTDTDWASGYLSRNRRHFVCPPSARSDPSMGSRKSPNRRRRWWRSSRERRQTAALIDPPVFSRPSCARRTIGAISQARWSAPGRSARRSRSRHALPSPTSGAVVVQRKKAGYPQAFMDAAQIKVSDVGNRYLPDMSYSRALSRNALICASLLCGCAGSA